MEQEIIPGYEVYEPKPQFGTKGEFMAFNIITKAMGLKIRYNKNDGDIPYENIRGYKRQPTVIYEMYYNKIIRTVNTFQYLAQSIDVDNRCRFFEVINYRKLKENKAQHIVRGISNETWKLFHKRFYVGRLHRFDSKDSDLDMRVKWVKVNIMGRNYFLISVQKLNSDELTPWRMVISKRVKGATPNPKIPIRLTQQEIIEKLENWEIRKIGHYGDPKKFYTRTEALAILSQEYITLP